MQPLLEQYATRGFFDEFAGDNGAPRTHYVHLAQTLGSIDWDDFKYRVAMVNDVLLRRGVTFTVYADKRANERIMPFDVIPRLVAANEWTQIERGLKQRLTALNLFLCDIYGAGLILKNRRIPADLVYSSGMYVREMVGVHVPRDVYVHIAGIDLVRGAHGEVFVLEDNLRTPSGISYVLENRAALKRSFPQLFEHYAPRPVDDYPRRLRATLGYAALGMSDDPTMVLLTPGIYNSAYFEHTMLARRMGIELVEGPDLMVRDNVVYLKTTKGLRRVDVIYRRIDDDFLDPLYFRTDSILGVAGLMNAYRAGNVVIANAIGTGVADDKAIYPYVPDMIDYYLKEEPILPNVPTYHCTNLAERKYVIDHLDELVVKQTGASGGYGMLIGPASTRADRVRFADQIEATPREFIAQPIVPLSCHPTYVEDEIAPRHVDLRPFVLHGAEIDVPPTALTRVALVKDSLVVNSSQGGGSKDTWILEGD